MEHPFLKHTITNNNKTDVSSFFDVLYSKKSLDWEKIQEKQLLHVFKTAATNVPAYRKFLKKRRINPKDITSAHKFDRIPSINKKNYLRMYPWQELSKDKGLIKNSLVMTATSGSTGEPFYFPRTSAIDLQSSIYHEMFLRSSNIAKNTATLVIDCFGMGVWIGGLITYQAFKYIGERGTPATVITPGINKQEIFQALKNIAPHFDNIILCGYPPFMKDVIDQAADHGISWKDYHLKIIFAAEGFSESFRDYIVKQTGIKNVYRDIMNIYGSADLGTMAQETPLTVLIRRLALQNSQLYTSLFGETKRLPTLAQYIPNFINFETNKGSICCTGDNVLPLVRYEIGDTGLTLTYRHVEEIFRKEGIDLDKEIEKAGITDTVTELPFVCVYERADFSTKLYGAIIYPEYIKKGLQHEILDNFITGKFTMSTKYKKNHDAYLEINIELRQGVKETKQLKENIIRCVSHALAEESAEHKNNISMLSKKKVEPIILFWSFGHETYFKVGGKQKWVRNEK